MRRDFSENAKQELLALVDQVEKEKWCDLTDWFGDRWYDFQTWTGKLNIDNYMNNVKEYHKKVIDKNNTTRNDIERIFNDVHKVDDRNSAGLGSLRNDFRSWMDYVNKLSEMVDPSKGIDEIYWIRIELKLIYDEISAAGKTKLNWYKIEQRVYKKGSRGYFGGNQGSPKNRSRAEKDELYKIFKKNNPDIDLSAADFDIYLRRLNSEGCGYVALVNTIICYYISRPDEFRKVFGYDLYDEYGNPAYDKLLMDIYSRMDNRGSDGKYDPYYDYNPKKDGKKEDYDVWKDTTGRGTHDGNRKDYLEEFMKEHGVDVTVTTGVTVTPENCEELLESGKQITISFHDGNLRNMDGSVAQYIDGGHAMTVVGVTPEGYYIVSSWGRQYYIDPNENTGKTAFWFSTVEF